MANSHEQAEFHWRRGANIIHPEWTEDQVAEFIRKRKALLDRLTPAQHQQLLKEREQKTTQLVADLKAGSITKEAFKQQVMQFDTEPLAKTLFGIDAAQL